LKIKLSVLISGQRSSFLLSIYETLELYLTVTELQVNFIRFLYIYYRFDQLRLLEACNTRGVASEGAVLIMTVDECEQQSQQTLGEVMGPLLPMQV